MSEFTDMLRDGAAKMGVDLNEKQCAAFETYHAMLIDANTRMNLTRVPDDLREAIDRNYLDSIAPIAKDFPKAESCADVGSGAGFPGIPLAIALPDTRFVLMDALGKRVEFLNDVIAKLGLKNAEAVHIRAEDAGKSGLYREKFDLVCARAVAGLNLLCEYLLPLAHVGGCMLALKGPNAQEEIDAAGNALNTLGGTLLRADDLIIPERDWQHKAVWIAKTAPTPAKYPRKAGVPEKKPL